jgi:methyl-accepting chemotaxis protein
LDQVITQNAASSEEMSSTAEELFSQAALLQSAIGFFKVNESLGELRTAVAGTAHYRQDARKGKPALLASGPSAQLRRLQKAVVGQNGTKIALGGNTGSHDEIDQDFVAYKGHGEE